MNALLSEPVKRVKMTPAEDREGVRVDVDAVYLDDIPKAMDNMGWEVSAKLMRRWFATKPAWVMPADRRAGNRPDGTAIDYTHLPASQVDNQIVRMAWAMRFDQVKEAIAQLKQRWNSREGVDRLAKLLERAGWEKGRTCRLGDVSMCATELDAHCQVNAMGFGSAWATLDDFYGAIFRATLKAAVVGTAYRGPFSGRDMFQVEQLGFYLRDTYDFNAGSVEDAYMGLGVWSKERVLSKVEAADFNTLSGDVAHLLMRQLKYPNFVQVRNGDFRRWQQRRNEGGDFFVFSDVLWEPYGGPAIELP